MTGKRGGGFIFDTNSIHRGQVAGNRSRTVILAEFMERKTAKAAQARRHRGLRPRAQAGRGARRPLLLDRNRRCGVWVQSGASCDVSDATFSKNGEHGVALSEDKSSAVLRRCAFAGRDDHLACFNGAAFSSLDARDCCYEPGDDDSPRLEAGL